jgi:hypothetical protein
VAISLVEQLLKDERAIVQIEGAKHLGPFLRDPLVASEVVDLFFWFAEEGPEPVPMQVQAPFLGDEDIERPIRTAQALAAIWSELPEREQTRVIQFVLTTLEQFVRTHIRTEPPRRPLGTPQRGFIDEFDRFAAEFVASLDPESLAQLHQTQLVSATAH